VIRQRWRKRNAKTRPPPKSRDAAARRAIAANGTPRKAPLSRLLYQCPRPARRSCRSHAKRSSSDRGRPAGLPSSASHSGDARASRPRALKRAGEERGMEAPRSPTLRGGQCSGCWPRLSFPSASGGVGAQKAILRLSASYALYRSRMAAAAQALVSHSSRGVRDRRRRPSKPQGRGQIKSPQHDCASARGYGQSPVSSGTDRPPPNTRAERPLHSPRCSIAPHPIKAIPIW
jgi:hypothetical protein